jgi:hypothetical protein
MRKSQHLKKAQWKKIYEMRQEGYTWGAIGARFHRTHPTVMEAYKKYEELLEQSNEKNLSCGGMHI